MMDFTMRAMRWASSPMRSRLAVALKSEQQPQVARSGLTPGNDGGEFIVDFHLHGIDPVLDRTNLLHGLKTELRERIDRLAYLGFHQPPISITRWIRR